MQTTLFKNLNPGARFIYRVAVNDPVVTVHMKLERPVAIAGLPESGPFPAVSERRGQFTMIDDDTEVLWLD